MLCIYQVFLHLKRSLCIPDHFIPAFSYSPPGPCDWIVVNQMGSKPLSHLTTLGMFHTHCLFSFQANLRGHKVKGPLGEATEPIIKRHFNEKSLLCVYIKPLRFFFSFPAPKVRVKLKHPKLGWYWNLEQHNFLLLRLSHTLKKNQQMGIPWKSIGQDSVLPLHGAWVQSLVRDFFGLAKKKV